MIDHVTAPRGTITWVVTCSIVFIRNHHFSDHNDENELFWVILESADFRIVWVYSQYPLKQG